jgi:hypothetical protein
LLRQNVPTDGLRTFKQMVQKLLFHCFKVT